MKRRLTRTTLCAILFSTAATLGGGCDFATKEWAQETLEDEPGRRMPLLDPHVELSLAYNRGTSFSVIQDLGAGRIVLGAFALGLVIALFVMAVRHPEKRLQSVALGILAGGALGNGIDRVARDGVIDFIVVHYPWGGSWPAFNVADALLVVGVAMLLIEPLVRRARPSPTAAS